MMTELVFERESLDKLLKIARAEKRALEIDLIDIEQARNAAQNAFANLSAGRDVDEERRKCLQRSILSLHVAEDSARDRFQNIANEIAKLDHIFASVTVSPSEATVHQLTQSNAALQDQRTG